MINIWKPNTHHDVIFKYERSKMWNEIKWLKTRTNILKCSTHKLLTPIKHLKIVPRFVYILCDAFRPQKIYTVIKRVIQLAESIGALKSIKHNNLIFFVLSPSISLKKVFLIFRFVVFPFRRTCARAIWLDQKSFDESQTANHHDSLIG